MLGKNRLPHHPNTLFIIVLMATVAVGALSCVLAYAFGGSDLSGPSLLPGEKVTVLSSDMLGTEITISGVTIPLAMLYLLIKDKELQLSIAEKTAYYLKKNNITLSLFRSTYVVMKDTGNDLKASPCLDCVNEFLDLGSQEGAERLSSDASEWLFPDEGLRAHYNQTFADGSDHELVEKCIAFVAIPALLCFADMFLRYVGLRHVILDIAEIFLIVSTASANIFTYFILYKLLSIRNRIKTRSSKEVRKACNQIKDEVNVAAARSNSLSNEEERKLQADLDYARAR